MTDYPFRWLYQPRGGYGYTIAVPCRILFEEQGMRTKIAALRADIDSLQARLDATEIARDAAEERVARLRRAAEAVLPRQAWYHADFCHAYAWVYEDGENLRVKWAEREDVGLSLHMLDDCERCRELSRNRSAARYGEFSMSKPSAEFSSAEAFFVVLAEIAKWVPGLIDENGAGEGSRPSSPVAPDGPETPAVLRESAEAPSREQE